MVAIHSVQAALAELERLFGVLASDFRDVLFQGHTVGSPVITIQARGRRGAIAWFAPNRWENGEPGAIPEINICAEHLKGDRYTIANSLLHELVHYANWLQGIRDCSDCRYHNRRFKERCEQVGLRCEYLGRRYGWAATSLSSELKARVDGLRVNDKAFGLFRRSSPTKTKDPS